MAYTTIADLLRRIKANSSKWVNEKFGDNHKFAWQDGYGAFTVSESQLNTGIVHANFKTNCFGVEIEIPM
ncbi:MAG: transposase [Deltaproteobacteria bacterium]|nr:transposase [Deltaproteobacteria bacterium]